MSISPPPPTTTNVEAKVNQPNTQGRDVNKPRRFRDYLQVWMQELPTYPFSPPEPDPSFQLIQEADWNTITSQTDKDTADQMEADKKFLDYELLRLFRERDYEAKKQQNRYRLIQIGFMLLAAIATMIGALQALALSNDPTSLPFLAFFETLVALLATFLSTIAGREPPLPIWLSNRRRAEQLRREYFRYLVNLPPYDGLDGYQRQMALSKRAADINRGVFPEEPALE
jgi:uncharacterized protein DUF4231